ncbi:MAG: hypothetical protein AB8U25_00460 [Rickettsiales endosymbiont of Dermacentor nuttalli]
MLLEIPNLQIHGMDFRNGEYLLHHAVWNKIIEVSELLIQAGADVKVKILKVLLLYII